MKLAPKIIKEGFLEAKNISDKEALIFSGILGLLAVPAYFEPNDPQQFIGSGMVLGSVAMLCVGVRKYCDFSEEGLFDGTD